VRIFAALLIVGVLAANVFAAAISFTGSSTLGVGTASIAACDEDGFTVKPVTDWDSDSTKFMVTELVLGSGLSDSELINIDCISKTVKGIILNFGSTSIGEILAGAIGGTASETFSLSSAVDAEAAYGYAFEIAD
jgi:hypothetical protein